MPAPVAPKLKTFTMTMDADEFVVLESLLEQVLAHGREEQISSSGRRVAQQLLVKVRTTKPNPKERT